MASENERVTGGEDGILRFVKEQDLRREYAPGRWEDGALLGNGSLGAVGYAPGGLEWILNKTDVFDRRIPKCAQMRHADVMEHVARSEDKTPFFLEKEEIIEERVDLYSISAGILKLYYGYGELDWNAPAFPKISQDLSIYEGKLTNAADAHFMHSVVKSIIPRGRSVFALRLEGCSICDWEHTIEFYRPFHQDMEPPVWHEGEAGEIIFTQDLPGKEGWYAAAVKVVSRPKDAGRISYPLPADYDGSRYENSISGTETGVYSARIREAGDMDLFVSVFSDYDGEDPLKRAVREVRRAAADGFETLEKENADWWREYWRKSAVDLRNDPDLQQYWYYSSYVLACSCGAAPVPALSGMFYGPLSPTIPGTASNTYVHDQNMQIPVMPLSAVNHHELVSALADTYLNAEEEIRRHTEELFGETGGKGMFIPLVTNQNVREKPSPVYRYTMCGGAYLGLVFSLTWRISRDDDQMRENFFPLIRGIIRFYVTNRMSVGDDGKYHLDWSIPPEIFRFTRDDTATLAMLRVTIETALAFAGLEGIADEETALWEDVLRRYPSFAKRPEGGWWGGPDIPYEHFSFGTHLLYPFFPSAAALSEEDRAAAQATLDYISENAVERTYACEDGWRFVHDWSFFLYNSTRMRLGRDKKAAWEALERFLREFSKSNGLFTHNGTAILPPDVTEGNHKRNKPAGAVTADMTTTPSWYGSGKCATENAYSRDMTPPVIEGNAIFLFCTTEALLQSYDGIIRVFPCVPEDFTGGFYGLVAQGGFEVSAEMKNGTVTMLKVRARKDACLRAEISGSILERPMKAGESVILV